MTATTRTDDAAEIDPSYLPGGASVNMRLGPTRVYPPSGISIGSAHSAELAVVTNA